MTHALLGSVIEKYYQQIDANDLDSVLMLFAADACYERADAVFADKAAIEIFFREQRLIRGIHKIEQILSLGRRVLAMGRFEGVGEKGDQRSVGFVDIWDFDDTDLVKKRRTFLATGHSVVQR